MSQEYRHLGAPIPEHLAGQRLDLYLARNYPFLTRNQWQKRLETRKVLVNDSPVKPSYQVRYGDILMLHSPNSQEPEVNTDIVPIWKRGDVMAFSKPSPLPMHEVGPYRFNTFAHLVNQKFGTQWAAVHRLDMETSGIVLCGRTPEARVKLARGLAKRKIEKTYLLMVRGSPKWESWTEEGAIGDLADSQIRIKKWVVDDGLPSSTLFEVIDRIPGYTLMRAYPRTGRTNQIRIHTAHLGFPVIGDKLYDPDENTFLDFFEHGMTQEILEKVLHPRLCLHAYRLEFSHPQDSRQCVVKCEMAQDMVDLWNRLKK